MRDLLTRVSYIGGEGVGGGRAFALYYHSLPHNFFRNKPHTAPYRSPMIPFILSVLSVLYVLSALYVP